jgi:TRAP transporter 4TM/12TM fusion protein
MRVMKKQLFIPFDNLFGRGRKRVLNSRELMIKDVLAFVVSVYVILSVFLFPNPLIYRVTVFSFYFGLVFLTYTSPNAKSDRVSKYDYLLMASSFFLSLYFTTNAQQLILRKPFITEVSSTHMILGLVCFWVITEGVRRVSGMWIPVINFAFLMYFLFGQYIPGRFGHTGFSLAMITDGLFLSRFGVWGVTMGVASGSLIITIIFSTFIIESGLGNIIMKMLDRFSLKGFGASAKLAVLSSSIFGMISGGGASNVTTTGSITIPLMINKGYNRVYAAALESSASMASTFTPPIMGSVAFLMAELLGISYAQIIRLAIMPAILYFFSLYMFIHVHTEKNQIEPSVQNDQSDPIKISIKDLLLFLPLIYFLFRAFSSVPLSRIGLESIFLCIVISPFLKEVWFTPKRIIQTLIKAIMRTLPIITTMVASGVFIGIINLTGFATKFSIFFRLFSQFPTIILLALIAMVIIFLGLALNTPSTYLISVVFFAPLLVQLGFQMSTVHMFILIYSAVGSITPPVALTALTAAIIAEADATLVGFKAMLLSVFAYLLPIVFMYHPHILSPSLSLGFFTSVLNISMGFIMIIYTIEGWFIHRSINRVQRVLVALLSIVLLWFSSSFVLLLSVSLFMLVNVLLTTKRRVAYEKDFA